MDQLEYADVPPAGFRMASHDHVIASGDKVCVNLMDLNGGWERPRTGQNIIGASVRDLWPRVMAVAVPSL